MRLLIGVFLIGASIAAPASAGEVVVLRCSLKHSVPRDPQHRPKPFTQHFHLDLDAKTVDGVPATVADGKIGWEPQQSYLRPYASLTLPDYTFRDVKYHGKTSDVIAGSCVKEG